MSAFYELTYPRRWGRPTLSAAAVARALDGDVVGRDHVLIPGKGHSRRDRSVSVRLEPRAPGGILVHCFGAGDWRTEKERICAALGLDGRRQTRRSHVELSAKRPARAETGNTSRALEIWAESDTAAGTIVERVYFPARGLAFPRELAGAVLRFHPRCPWRDDETGKTIFVPAMIAPMRDIWTDEIRAIHRTCLAPDGSKRIARKFLGTTRGTALKLDDDADVYMGLALGEGIETTLAAREVGLRPRGPLGAPRRLGHSPS